MRGRNRERARLGWRSASAAPIEYDTDALAYIAAMTTPPSQGEKDLIDTLIKGFKADGIWTKIGWFSLLAGETSQASLLNGKTPAQTLAAVNAPTFTADRGWTGDGVAAHLTFGRLYGTIAPYAETSMFAAAFCNQQSVTTGQTWHLGDEAATAGQVRVIINSNTAATVNNRFNNDTNIQYTATGSSRVGRRIITRTGTTCYVYKDGVAVLNAAALLGVSALPTANGALLRRSTTYSNDRVAFTAVGSYLNPTEALALDTRVNAYLTAKGAN